MNRKLFAAFALVAAVAGSSGFLGARALQAEEKATHFAADSPDLDRTKAYLCEDIVSATQTLRMIAQDTTVENAEMKKAEREAAIGNALKPFQEDAQVLGLQGHLLCLDRIVDTGGEPAKQFIQQGLFERLKVSAEDVAKREQETGLGHGGTLIGYLIAAATKTPADDIFKLKKDHAWPEVMRAKGVTMGQLTSKLEGKD